MQPSTLARQTSSPSASSGSRPPSSTSSTLATFRKPVISLPQNPLNAPSPHGEQRAGHSVAGRADQKERSLDDLLHAHPFAGDLFGRGMQRIQVGLRDDQAGAERVHINPGLFALL